MGIYAGHPALLMFGVFAGERSARQVSWLAIGALVVTAVLIAARPRRRAA
jgi:hypothetical protein